jgi:hypothetical protein
VHTQGNARFRRWNSNTVGGWTSQGRDSRAIAGLAGRYADLLFNATAVHRSPLFGRAISHLRHSDVFDAGTSNLACPNIVATASFLAAARTRRANHSQPCPALFAKIFWFSERANQFFIRAIPFHTEGRCATSPTRSGMRWTLTVLLTRALDADGEVVWS